MGILKRTIIENENVKIENILWESSNILKTSYNFNSNQLFVTFKKGGVYYYANVYDKTYSEMLESTSIGVYVNKTIIPQHTCIKKGVADDEIINGLITEINELISKGKEKLSD